MIARQLRPAQVRLAAGYPRRLAAQLLPVVFCGFALGIPPLGAATLVHHPYLQNLRQDRVTVVWSMKEKLDASVQYSADQSFSQSAAAPPPVTFTDATTGVGFTFYQYRAELTGLTPDTHYSYQVLAGGVNVTPESDFKFHTPGSGQFSFLVFGDSGQGTSAQLNLTSTMVKENPDFVVHVGDIAYESGTFPQFQANYFDYYSTLMRRANFFTAPGNHEYYTNSAAPYLALHAPPTDTVPVLDSGRYYSFDWGDAHFVALDSNLVDPTSNFGARAARMLAWLDSDLSKTHAAWRIVFFHHLPYPVSQHVDDPICIAMHDSVIHQYLEKYGVQLVLSGHEHSYMRTKPLHSDAIVPAGLGGTVYITSGGGGGALHPVSDPMKDNLAFQKKDYHYLRVSGNDSQMTIQAIGIDGKAFDSTILTSLAVLNAASNTSDLAPGELVSIYGQSLGAGTSQASTLPWPSVLAGATVSLNGTPVPLFYSSPTQINAQLPLDVQGTAILRVDTATGGFAETPITISDTAPAIFPGGILHGADNSPVTAGAQAKAGETLVLYMTGLGNVDGPITAGAAAPNSPLLRVLAPVQVQMGDVSVTPDFAGLTPGFVGLYQVNVVVPSNLTSKVYPLRVAVRGNLSNSMMVPVLGRVP